MIINKNNIDVILNYLRAIVTFIVKKNENEINNFTFNSRYIILIVNRVFLIKRASRYIIKHIS